MSIFTRFNAWLTAASEEAKHIRDFEDHFASLWASLVVLVRHRFDAKRVAKRAKELNGAFAELDELRKYAESLLEKDKS